MPEDLNEFLLHVLPALRTELGHARTGLAQLDEALRSTAKRESSDAPISLVQEYERNLKRAASRLLVAYEAAGLHESRRELSQRWGKFESKGLDRLVRGDDGLSSLPLELLGEGLASLEMLAGTEEADQHDARRPWLESMLSRAGGLAEAESGLQVDRDAAAQTIAGHLAAAFEDFAPASRLRLPAALAQLHVVGGIRSQRALVELLVVRDKAELSTAGSVRLETLARATRSRAWSRLYTVFYAHEGLSIPRAWAREIVSYEWLPLISLSPRATPRKPIKSGNAKKAKKRDKKSK